MSLSEVTARISAIETRIASLAVTAPSAPVAPTAGVPNFSAMLGAAGAVPAALPNATPTGLGLTGATVPATFSAVDRPVFGSAVRAVQVQDASRGSQTPLSAGELRDVLAQAGFTGDALRTAYAIARRESGGRPGATSPENSNGTRDHGLFQINDVHRAADWIDFNRLDDPLYNAQVAFRMSDGGRDFSSWGLGDRGWAGHLQETAPDRYAALMDRFQTEYAKYPFD